MCFLNEVVKKKKKTGCPSMACIKPGYRENLARVGGFSPEGY